MIAAGLYIVALQFRSGNTICIRNAHKRRSASTAQNADVAQTLVGVTYLSFMRDVWRPSNMLYMCSPQTHICARPKNLTTFALHCLGRRALAPIHLKNTILALAKQWNTEYVVVLCVRKCASGDPINHYSCLCNNVANVCWQKSRSPSRFLMTTNTNTER